MDCYYYCYFATKALNFLTEILNCPQINIIQFVFHHFELPRFGCFITVLRTIYFVFRRLRRGAIVAWLFFAGLTTQFTPF